MSMTSVMTSLVTRHRRKNIYIKFWKSVIIWWS